MFEPPESPLYFRVSGKERFSLNTASKKVGKRLYIIEGHFPTLLLPEIEGVPCCSLLVYLPPHNPPTHTLPYFNLISYVET